MYTNIQELNIASPAPFSNDKLINFRKFITDNDIHLKDEIFDSRCDMPMNKIVGIDPMDGVGSWGSCLEGSWLKRLDRRLKELDDNPNYYLSVEPKEELSFKKVGEYYFITGGKHRTIIARFLAHFNQDVFNGYSPLRNVLVTEHFVDEEFYQLRARIERLGDYYPQLTFKVEHYTDEDESGFLKVSSSLSNSSNYAYYSRSEAHSVINILEKPRLRDKLNASNIDNCIYKFISLKDLFLSKLEKLKNF